MHYNKWTLFGWASQAILPLIFWPPACCSLAIIWAGGWHGDLWWGISSISISLTWFDTGSGSPNTSAMGLGFEAILVWKRFWAAGISTDGELSLLWPWLDNSWICWEGELAVWVICMHLFCCSQVEGVWQVCNWKTTNVYLILESKVLLHMMSIIS